MFKGKENFMIEMHFDKAILCIVSFLSERQIPGLLHPVVASCSIQQVLLDPRYVCHPVILSRFTLFHRAGSQYSIPGT